MVDIKTLTHYQKLIEQLVVERGFDKETVPQVFMLLAEEVGELSKAIRKLEGVTTDKNSKIHDVEEELADCFWLLLDLSNRLGVDLEQAFLAKEEKNKQRKWS